MPTPRRALAVLSLIFAVAAPAAALAEGSGPLSPVAPLRPEWTVQRTAAGRVRIVGYLYNENELRDAANVWLRVEQVTAAGDVGKAYRTRIMGDVLSRGRMAFDVPVAEATAGYRVLVESVDWVGECR